MTGLKVKNVEDAIAALWTLQSFGCRTAIITLGKDGAVYLENSGTPEHVAAQPVTAIDTTVTIFIECNEGLHSL